MARFKQSSLPLRWPGPRRNEQPLPRSARHIERCSRCGAQVVRSADGEVFDLASVQTHNGQHWLLRHRCPQKTAQPRGTVGPG